jgi:hypothetical protein
MDLTIAEPVPKLDSHFGENALNQEGASMMGFMIPE